MIEIRSGLEGDRVVASGQFLIDSESNLLAGFRRLSSPGTTHPHDAHEGHQHAESRRPNDPVVHDKHLNSGPRAPLTQADEALQAAVYSPVHLD